MSRYLRALAAPCTGGAVLAVAWIVIGPLVFGLQRSIGFGVVLGLVWASAWMVTSRLHSARRRAGGARSSGPSC